MSKKSIGKDTRYSIVRTLRKQGDMSKAELAKRLKLSKPAVAEHVNKLLEKGIIFEKEEGEASKAGGRKPTPLSTNHTYRYVVGLDLSLEEPICAVGNLNYDMVSQLSIAVTLGADEEKRLTALSGAVHQLLKESSISGVEIGCIVISTPGIVKKDGRVYFSNPQHDRWTELDIVGYLEQEFQVKVILNNDVNLALLAEMAIGQGKKYKNQIYISAGVGVGSGLALNRKIYEGEQYAAGEIGYFIDGTGDGRTLEEKINLNSIMKQVEADLKNGQQTLLQEINRPVQFKDIVKAYAKEDAYVKSLFYERGKILGTAIVNIVSLLDIGIVFLGGLYSEFYDEMLTGIQEMVDKVNFIQPNIQKSEFHSESCVYGAFVAGTEYVLRTYCE